VIRSEIGMGDPSGWMQWVVARTRQHVRLSGCCCCGLSGAVFVFVAAANCSSERRGNEGRAKETIVLEREDRFRVQRLAHHGCMYGWTEGRHSARQQLVEK